MAYKAGKFNLPTLHSARLISRTGCQLNSLKFADDRAVQEQDYQTLPLLDNRYYSLLDESLIGSFAMRAMRFFQPFSRHYRAYIFKSICK